jgi:hypothetical protein
MRLRLLHLAYGDLAWLPLNYICLYSIPNRWGTYCVVTIYHQKQTIKSIRCFNLLKFTKSEDKQLELIKQVQTQLKQLQKQVSQIKKAVNIGKKSSKSKKAIDIKLLTLRNQRNHLPELLARGEPIEFASESITSISSHLWDAIIAPTMWVYSDSKFYLTPV